MQNDHLQKIIGLVKAAAVLTLPEKSEWLELMDLMNDRQLLELERILEDASAAAIHHRQGYGGQEATADKDRSRIPGDSADLRADKSAVPVAKPAQAGVSLSQVRPVSLSAVPIAKPPLPLPPTPKPAVSLSVPPKNLPIAKEPGPGPSFRHILNFPKAGGGTFPPAAAPVRLESKTVEPKKESPFLAKLKAIFSEKELPAPPQFPSGDILTPGRKDFSGARAVANPPKIEMKPAPLQVPSGDISISSKKEIPKISVVARVPKIVAGPPKHLVELITPNKPAKPEPRPVQPTPTPSVVESAAFSAGFKAALSDLSALALAKSGAEKEIEKAVAEKSPAARKKPEYHPKPPLPQPATYKPAVTKPAVIEPMVIKPETPSAPTVNIFLGKEDVGPLSGFPHPAPKIVQPAEILSASGRGRAAAEIPRTQASAESPKASDLSSAAIVAAAVAAARSAEPGAALGIAEMAAEAANAVYDRRSREELDALKLKQTADQEAAAAKATAVSSQALSQNYSKGPAPAASKSGLGGLSGLGGMTKPDLIRKVPADVLGTGKITLPEKPGDDMKLETLADIAALNPDDLKQHATGTMFRKFQKLIGQYGPHEVAFRLEQSPLYKAYINTGVAWLKEGARKATAAALALPGEDFERFMDLLIVMRSRA